MSLIRRPRPLVALLATTALLLGACAGDDPVIDLETAPDEVAGAEGQDEPEPDDEPEPEPEPEPDPEPSATPDPDLVADPCAPHQDREMEAFIEVASPVDGQDLGDGGDVALVGCSSVFEATVAWELQSSDGTVLTEGFTTAECGGPCIGAFDDTIDLTAGAGQGEAELHVFSPDASGGEGIEIREVVVVTFG